MPDYVSGCYAHLFIKELGRRFPRMRICGEYGVVH